MFPFSRPRTIKDIGDRLRGRVRRYRLPRNGGVLSFVGTLLTFYRHQNGPEAAPFPPEVGYVDLLAVFRTRAGRSLVYYIVACSGHDDLTLRREYAHVCHDTAALADFLDAMTYPNKTCFVDRIVAEAAGRPVSPPTAATPEAPGVPGAPERSGQTDRPQATEATATSSSASTSSSDSDRPLPAVEP